MPEAWFELSPKDRTEVLYLAADRTGRAAHVLEKDVWVVWALSVLYGSKLADVLTFKGGTSLSKVYKVIDRVSEDVDLTYDIRKFVPDMLPEGESLPKSRRQMRNITDAVRKKLPLWYQESLIPVFQQAIPETNSEVSIKCDENPNVVAIVYPALVSGTGYVARRIQLEFGARATGEPNTRFDVYCDAASAVPEIMFPTATPVVMKLERTFWEKATLAHVYCRQGKFRGGYRFSRHWYDLAAIAKSSHINSAIADGELANDVAQHQACFFRENDDSGHPIDYVSAVNGEIELIPDGDALKTLDTDYDAMIDDGLLEEGSPTFNEIVDTCRGIEKRINDR